MFSRIKELLILGGSILLLGMVSCNKATDDPVQEPGSATVPAKVSLTAQLGDATKASYAAGGKVSWQVGDKIVLYDVAASPKVLSELSCISADSNGKGTFSGSVPASWTGDRHSATVFFLGNRSIAGDVTQIEVNLSEQDGTASGVGRFIFLYKFEDEDSNGVPGEEENYATVSFTKSGDTYLADETISFNGSWNAIMEMTFSGTGCPAGTPGESGYKAKKVTIEGLKNKFTIHLNQNPSSAVTEDAPHAEKTTIAPGSVAKYADTYFLSVVPDASNTNVTITADYQDGGVGTTTLKWNPMDWSSVVANKYYYINWNNDKTFVQLSSKQGYNGASIDGGTADGKTGKNGYNGANADGSIYYPTTNKSGYNGVDLD